MIPLPDIANTIASATPAAQSTYNAFKSPMYFELGITIGALLLVFLVVKFWNGIMALVRGVHKYDFGDSSAVHRDTEATSKAIAQHKHYLKLISGKDKISRYDK